MGVELADGGGKQGLGGRFGRLWAGGAVSGIGDGVTQVAGALLGAAVTTDPVWISGLLIAQMVPWMLFGLPSGVLVDRLDRRRLMIAAGLARAAALGVLAAAVPADRVSMPLLYGVFFVVGCAGLLFDNASTAALPALVDVRELERANGRLQATKAVGEQLVARPLGSWLFAVAMWAPFLLDAGALLLVAALAATLPRAVNPGPRTGSVRMRTAVAEGSRRLFGNRLLRTVTLTVGLSNIGLGAVFSIMVLVAHERLGVGAFGYGGLLTAAAFGGVVGGLAAPWIIGTVGPGTALRVGLLVEVVSYVGLALTDDAVVVAVILVPLSMHLGVFSTVCASLRQSLVPSELLGRVHSAYRLVGTAGLFLGAGLGGLLGRYCGLAAPFWLGFGCAVVFTLGTWRVLNNRNIQAARDTATHAAATPPASR